MNASDIEQATPLKAQGAGGRNDIENPPHSIAGGEHSPPSYGKSGYLYFRYVNPWVRILLGIVIVYFYAVLLNVTTFRTANLGEITLKWPQVYEVTVPREDGRGVHLVLQDLLYTQIPRVPMSSPEWEQWKTFLDFCSMFFNVLVVVLCLLRRDILRLWEFLGLQLTLYVIMYFTKIITLYPAPLYTEGCLKPEHRIMGRWVWTEVFTTDFCGDQMFSGHTNNTLLPMIILTRILYDIVGWDFHLFGNKDGYHEPEYNNTYYLSGTTRADRGTFVDNNEDFWFHPRYDFVEPRKNWGMIRKVIAWSFMMFWRLLKWVIMAVFVYGLLHNRQHYTADIMVSIIMQLVLSSNTRYVQALVRWMYRPNYWNYRRTGLFSLVKLRQPLTPEQANYEDRVHKLGRGGLW